MDWSAIIYAGIGGGGGSLLGTVLGLGLQKMTGKSVNTETEGRTKSGVVAGLGGGLAVAGMVMVPALYKNMTLPRLVPIDHSEIFEGSPIYEVIREQSPDDYERLLLPIDRAARKGEVAQADLDEMRVILFQLINEKRMRASGATLREFEKVSQSQALVYKVTNPTICTLMINGEPYPSVVDYLGEREVELEQDVMKQLFINAPRDETFVADLDRGKVLFDSIITEAIVETGVTNVRPEINVTTENNAEHQKVCDLTVSFSSKKSKLSDEDLMHVMTYESSLTNAN